MDLGGEAATTTSGVRHKLSTWRLKRRLYQTKNNFHLGSKASSLSPYRVSARDPVRKVRKEGIEDELRPTERYEGGGERVSKTMVTNVVVDQGQKTTAGLPRYCYAA